MGASSSRQGNKVASSSTSNDMKTFKWTINGFSALLDQGEGWSTSGGFTINGFKWYMSMNPMSRKSGEKESYVSLQLKLARSSTEMEYTVETAFNLLIYDRLLGKKHIEKTVCHDFHADSHESGCTYMVPLETLKSSSAAGFLVNDICVLGVQFIRINRTKRNDAVTSTLAAKTSSFVHDAHTWTIDKFGEISTRWCYSDAFASGGYKWLITLYPEGDGDDARGHLSLFLKFDESNRLSSNRGVFLEMCLSVKNQTKGKDKSYTCRKQFDKKTRSWGWAKFMSLEEFKNPANGFLVKDTCAVEASIAILGTSKD